MTEKCLDEGLDKTNVIHTSPHKIRDENKKTRIINNSYRKGPWKDADEEMVDLILICEIY